MDFRQERTAQDQAASSKVIEHHHFSTEHSVSGIAVQAVCQGGLLQAQTSEEAESSETSEDTSSAGWRGFGERSVSVSKKQKASRDADPQSLEVFDDATASSEASGHKGDLGCDNEREEHRDMDREGKSDVEREAHEALCNALKMVAS